jgi:beta-mannosidase
LPTLRDEALDLLARAELVADGYIVTLEVDRFAHAVAVEADGFVPDDNFLHIEPGEPRRVFLRAQVPGQPLRGTVSALNGAGPVVIVPVARAGASDAD